MISTEDFDRLDLRVGTVLAVRINRKSRNPAYAMTIDFGELGVKKTSAQITKLYRPEDLIGSQVICCVNLPHMYIGLVKSEVRVIAAEPAHGIVLIRPDQPVGNGAGIR
jgi:tRNA-binding protein